MNKITIGLLIMTVLAGVISCKESKSIVNQSVDNEEKIPNVDGGYLGDSMHPPGYQVKKASISIVQGAEIYANGNMQSVVRVNYELKTGATLTSVKLKEFGTGKDLVEIGWIASDTKNDYDHNIGRARVNIEDVLEKKVLTYKEQYVSTEHSNEGIKICFEIISTLENYTNIYSTCNDEGFSQGVVQLFAHRPVIYTGADFYIIHLYQVFSAWNTFNDMWGDLYALRKKANVPENMTFTLKANKIIPFSPKEFQANSDDTFIKHYIRDYFGGPTDNPISYSSVYLLNSGFDKDSSGKEMKTNYKFVFLRDQLKTKGTAYIFPYLYNDLALFFRISMNWGRTQYSKYRCLLNEFGALTCWDGVNTASFSKSEANITNKSVRDNEIKLIDNYGTMHRFFVSYNPYFPYENFNLR